MRLHYAYHQTVNSQLQYIHNSLKLNINPYIWKVLHRGNYLCTTILNFYTATSNAKYKLVLHAYSLYEI